MRKPLVDILRSESSSEHVAYAEFITAFRKNANVVYCFYEGKEDKRYYSFRVEQTCKKKSKSFTCNGKEKVLNVYNLIKSKKEYNNCPTLFFVDKDFDFSIKNNSDVYTTPYYSVENFYSGEETLSKILSHEFEMSTNNIDYKKVIRLFKSIQKLFHKNILLFNSWLACQYDNRVKKGINTFLKIDDTVDKYFSNIVKCDIKSISDFSGLNNLDYIESTLFPDAPKIDKKTLLTKIELLRKLESYKYFRGKFEIKFLTSFLMKLQSETGKKCSSLFSKRYSCNLRFEHSTSISVLSQYAETPKCLLRYLEKRMKKVA